ncbi:MAG: hypothetical protein ATN33_03620 [Epulopiscium sp. Nele67-Bin001]|nr:MAG: hypothetical protein BEN18_06355 [Epulopiscium sp. Nuni2H_MBin001]OON90214.1 MAG: hypothetical protein ATN33_03620 [Epulopiscium sp. Nele67-Bin001]
MLKKIIFSLVLLFVTPVTFASTLDLVAEGAILIEADSGTILYSKNPFSQFYPASTTKILTSYILLQDVVDPFSTVTQTQSSKDIVPADSSNIGLKVGDTYTYLDGIHAVLLSSDNFVSHDLAVFHSGSITEFANIMNDVATQAGAINSNFVNPHGYHEPMHYTTPYDLALIAKLAFSSPTLREIASTVSYNFTKTNTNTNISLLNSAKVLRSETEFFNEYAVAAKTGFHTPAGYCIVAYAEYDDISLIGVILKSDTENQFPDMNKLLNYGGSNFKSEVIDGNTLVFNVSYSYWAEPYVSYMLTNKIIEPSNANYKSYVTGEQFVKMLEKILPGMDGDYWDSFYEPHSLMYAQHNTLTGSYAKFILNKVESTLPRSIISWGVTSTANILDNDYITLEEAIYLAYQLYVDYLYASNKYWFIPA